MDFLAWIESAALSTWIRESGSLWSYPTVLFLHTLGLGLVVGPAIVGSIAGAVDLATALAILSLLGVPMTVLALIAQRVAPAPVAPAL